MYFDLTDPYGLDAQVKDRIMLEAMNDLTSIHKRNCQQYSNILARLYREKCFDSLELVPFLPVGLFKALDLMSVPRNAVIKTLTSSGTSGNSVSRIYLDTDTAQKQTKALASIMVSFLGKKRRPMLIIDNNAFVSDRKKFNARAAGILGFSSFGREHYYCLDEDLGLDISGIKEFLKKYKSEPIFIFGFTFMVWQRLFKAIEETGEDFRFNSESILVHGGGWKRLVDQQVSNDDFKSALNDQLGIGNIHNYYGMVEQVGSIFMECEHGHLHAPVFADVIIRDPISLEPLGIGKEGVIQVLSCLPTSYPGHSLLTEDAGILLGVDNCPCGRLGKYFHVTGRLAQAEIRGCSDTRVM